MKEGFLDDVFERKSKTADRIGPAWVGFRVDLEHLNYFNARALAAGEVDLVSIASTTGLATVDYNLWPMFAFGFGGVFILTQMHGLGLSWRVRWALTAIFVALVLLVYNGRWAALNEIVRIPVIEYLAVAVLALLIGGGLWLYRRLRPGASSPQASAPQAGD